MSSAETALKSAMERLIAGRPERTDGALTKKTLYLEAGVSRATMNRATEVLKEWNDAVAQILGVDPEAKLPLTEERRLQKKLKAAEAKITGLRATVAGAVSLIALLTEENRYLRDQTSNASAARLADLEEFRSRDARPE